MKKIAGKTFKTREEAGLPPLTVEELEEAERRAHQRLKERDAIPLEQRRNIDDGRFSDDIKGTEFDPDWPPTPDKGEGEGAT